MHIGGCGRLSENMQFLRVFFGIGWETDQTNLRKSGANMDHNGQHQEKAVYLHGLFLIGIISGEKRNLAERCGREGEDSGTGGI